MKRGNKGFTLIEIMVVIAVMIALAGLLTPALTRARRQAKRAECASNLRQIGVAIMAYQWDTNEAFPKTITFEGDLVPEYLPDAAILNCPAGGEHPKYKYEQPGGSFDLTKNPIITCNNHGNRPNLLFSDGSVRVGAAPVSGPQTQTTQN